MRKMDCIDLNEYCSRGAISSVCDTGLCVMSHMNGFHNYSVQLQCVIPVNTMCIPIDTHSKSHS